MVMAVLTLLLTAGDQGTDIASTINLCTTPQCGCEWDGEGCYPPSDVCGAAVINGTPAAHYCRYDTLGPVVSTSKNATRESCDSKGTYPPSDTPTCQCYWDIQDIWTGVCSAPRGICADMEVDNGTQGQEYCQNINSRFRCESRSWGSWLLPAINQILPGVRHPVWCATSITTIIGPSLIANLMLLIT